MRSLIFAILTIASCGGLPAAAQTLFTYGKYAVSQQEFIRAFNKNNTGAKPDAKAYREYLDLYIRFKLKVRAGLDQRLDTLSAQKAELDNFRSQIVSTYINDDESMVQLVDEAFARSQKDVHLEHIYIPFSTAANDSTRSEQKINEAYRELEQGKSFEEVATKFSADPSVTTNHGDLGYITVFSLPYALETVAYTTATGKYSRPFHSKTAFHIFRVLDVRPTIGRMKAAQILLAFPPDASDVQKMTIKNRADSVYALLLHGASFTKLAEQFSNDNSSYLNGGMMPDFGAGRFNVNFEKAVFALDHDSAMSAPIADADGYHIVKRISHVQIPLKKEDGEYYRVVQQMVAADSRKEIARKLLEQKIMLQTHAKLQPVNRNHLFAYCDSVVGQHRIPKFADLNGNTVLLTVVDQRYNVNDWLKYMKITRRFGEPRAGGTDSAELNQFVSNTVLDYYRNHLEKYNPEFARQVNEFKEGNLLFEVMQRNVWDKAAHDNAGMRKFYATHKDKYWWESSVNALIFTCNNEALAREVTDSLRRNPRSWKMALKGHEADVQSDSGRYEVTQLPVKDNQVPAVREFSAPLVNASDNSASFVYIIKAYPSREPRSFDDAKGFVLNDYQQMLEEQWMALLKSKYPVKVNENTFAELK